MFLSDSYVIGNELCEYLGINQSCLSTYRKEREEQEDFTSAIRLSGTVFINLDSPHLHDYLRVPKSARNFTSLKNMLPVSYLRDFHELREKDLKSIGGEKINIFKNIFWVFKDSFINEVTPKRPNVTRTVTYVLPKLESIKLLKEGKIQGIIPLSSHRDFVYYYV